MLRTLEGTEPTDVPHACLFLWAEGRVEVGRLMQGDTLIVGRGRGSDLEVDDVSVSRQHARFTFDGNVVTVTDLGSRNGTLFGDKKVESAVLADGAHVMLGAVAVGVRTVVPATSVAEAGLVALVCTGEPGRSLVRNDPAEPVPGALWTGAAMGRLQRAIHRISSLAMPVLVLGETGTGKEIVARELHQQGGRAQQPFRAINCGAIPASLLEGVLFGYMRGAFTGADQARGGIFEEAAAGTVLLDEVGELSPPAQAALLRVLETRSVTRLGSTKEIPVLARVVAATHRDLRAMVQQGSFREDLFHRINAVVLEVPPLRERRDELRALGELFVRQALAEVGRDQIWVDDAVWSTLAAAPLTGNLRELRNILVRAVALSDGDAIQAVDVASAHVMRRAAASKRSEPSVQGSAQRVPPTVPPGALRDTLRQRELVAIREALKQTRGHRAQAAALLGIPIRTFRRRLKELPELSFDDMGEENDS